MRGSGWIPFLIATVVFVVVVVAPAAVGAVEMISGEASGREIRDSGALLLTTAAWAAGVTLGAMILGWFPGSVLGSLLSRRGFVPVAALCLMPICLPPYLMFWCWWQSWPQGSGLHTWVIEQDAMGLARGVTLAAALVFWAWPITAWCVAGSVAMRSHDEEEMQRLDGAPRWRRFAARLRASGMALGVAGTITFLFIFNNTTAFDLAQIRTLGFELRALVNDGGTARDVLSEARGGILVAVLCIGLVGIAAWRAKVTFDVRGGRIGKATSIAAVVVWTLGIGIPVVLLLREPVQRGEFATYTMPLRGYAESLGNTFATAAVAGGVAAVIAIGLASAWGTRLRLLRVLAGIQAAGWALAGLVPAMVVAVAVEATLNTPTLAAFAYRTPLAILAGYLARFGFIAVLMGMWIAAREARELRALREIDGAVRFRGQWLTSWPRWLAAGVAIFALVMVLSVGEVMVTGQLQPPGFNAIAGILLNNMHYQRDDLVVAMAVLIFGLALLACGIAAAVSLAMIPHPRRSAAKPRTPMID